MLTRDEAQKLAKKVIAFSTFPECQVNVSTTEQAYTRFANNGITTASLSLRQSVAVSVARDGKSGSYVANDFDDASLRNAVKKAEELASLAPVNSERLPALGPQEYPAQSNLDPGTAKAKAPEMIPHVKTIIDASLKAKLVAAGLIERSRSAIGVANKTGLFGYYEVADSQLTTTIRMSDGSSSGWAGQPAAKIGELDSAKLAATAIGKCLRWKNPQRLEPGNYTVVLEATAAADLIRLIQSGFPARNTEEGRTFLSKRGGGTLLGEKMFPEFVTLRSDPFDTRQPAAPWTGDLLPAKATTWIEKGVVANLAYDRYWASKTGKEPTGGGSLSMDGGSDSLEKLVASVERGVLITHLWYIRNVNPQTLQQTGLTRDGTFLIENGRITQPVMNFRFLESPVRLLKNTKRLGPALRVRGLEGGIMIAPSLVATDFPLPSISDAI